MLRSFLSARLVLMLVFPLSLLSLGCGRDAAPPPASIPAAESSSETNSNPTPGVAEPVLVRADGPSTATPARPETAGQRPDPEVVLQTSQGPIRIRLFPAKAPLTVDNFLRNYVDRGFYDQTIIHFVDPDFIIAAGGFGPDLQAASPGAYIANEARNGLKNLRGMVAMARDPQHIDSANSQFFINVVDNPVLDHQGEEPGEFGYCVFGEVVEGMDVVDRIAAVPVQDQPDFPSTPAEPILIEAARRAR